MAPPSRDELVSDEVEVSLEYRNPSPDGPSADVWRARVHVTGGLVRLRPTDTRNNGVKIWIDLFEGPPAVDGEEEEEEVEKTEELDVKEDSTKILATLKIRDDVETQYGRIWFRQLSDVIPPSGGLPQKFCAFLQHAWTTPPQGAFVRSQPMVLMENSMSEEGTSPLATRSTTSPASSEGSYETAENTKKINRLSSLKRTSSGRKRGENSEDRERDGRASVEEYRELAKFFEEVASSVFSMPERKRSRVVRLVRDILKCVVDE